MLPPSAPNVLYLVHRVPYPPNRGDRIRSYHLLRFLAARAHVSLACLADELVSIQTENALVKWCRRVAIVPLNRNCRWLNAAMSLASGGVATDGLFRSPVLKSIVAEWCGQTRFDTVVAFCSSMVQYFDQPQLLNTPKVVDLVDVDSQKWFDYANEASGLRRRLYELEGRRLRQLEQRLPSQTSAILLTTTPEAQLYRSFCPNDQTHAIPNGVDLDYFQPQPSPTNNADCQLVFVGALDYRANIEGVSWFCREVWPLARAAMPQLRLTLVGRNPAPAVARLASLPGVTVAANVPDVRPYLAEATLSIAPLQVARGVQNKILESLAMAKCVVASPQAIDGLDLEPGRHICPATTPEQWIETIRSLAAAPQLRDEIGRAGRQFVEQHHR